LKDHTLAVNFFNKAKINSSCKERTRYACASFAACTAALFSISFSRNLLHQLESKVALYFLFSKVARGIISARLHLPVTF
jgi:hypothetical protein